MSAAETRQAVDERPRFEGVWETKRLGEISHIKTGSRNNQDKVADGAYPFFVRSAVVEQIDSYSYDEEAILVPGEGGIGSIFHYIIGKFEVHQRVYRISRFREDVSGRYVFFHTRFRFGRHAEANSVKATVDSLRLPTFKAFEVPLPPLPEQRAIAAALSDVDDLLQSLDRLIAKKRNIKTGAMQQLLTGKTRLPGFSGKWETKRLGEIGEVSGSGVDKKSRDGETAVRLVNYLDAYRGRPLDNRTLNHWVTAPAGQVQRCQVVAGDVFFTPSSEVPDDIARSAVAKESIPDATYSYHVVRLRPSIPIDLDFRQYMCNTPVFFCQAHRLCSGSGTRYTLSLPQFRSLQISLPPLPEQRAIAAVLSDMDAEIDALEARRTKTAAIKRGMMQELLTGRTRLPIPQEHSA